MLQMSRILKLPHKSTLKEMVTLMHSSEAAFLTYHKSSLARSGLWRGGVVHSSSRSSLVNSYVSIGSVISKYVAVKSKYVSLFSKLRKRSSSSLFRYTINCALTTTSDISPRRLRRRAIRSQWLFRYSGTALMPLGQWWELVTLGYTRGYQSQRSWV